MACRFGKLSYNLTDDVIREIGRRGGVMGVIACTHYTHDGLRPTSKVKTFEDSMELVFAHIDRVAKVTGSHDHAAIGTDLDGWIKPALPASSTSAACATCRTPWFSKYGVDVADKISSGNVLALLRRAWR